MGYLWIVFWCAVFYLPLCWIVKKIEVTGKSGGLLLCHLTGVPTHRLMREIDEIEKRGFYKLW